ncbi:MAG: helix-turn-helix domain-containing protein [Gammaproteobacteria bacterium]|nr:helix-turn-helix domain-containing protein [Gammaproteobacteria bacterium]MCP5200717.1 helix-turn-helix domain-containing protein [Gammaproteobacteria bacterium]
MVEPASNEESRGAGLDGDASVGALVRRARERRGMSINDLSSCLKLEPRTLEALELEAYDKLPPAAFVRGYLRAIAKELDLDAPTLLAIFDDGDTHEAPELSDFKSRAPVQITSESHLVRYTTIGLGVLMVVLVALWWRAHGDRKLALDELVDETPPAAVEPATDPLPYEFELVTHPDVTRYNQPPPEEAPPATDLTAPTAADPATPAAGAADEAPAAAPAETAAEAPSGATENAAEPATLAAAPAADAPPEIVITANEDAWIDVKDASGRRLYFDFARPGRAIRLRGEAPYALVVGNSAAVQLEFRGAAVDLATYANEGVARLDLGR